MGPSRRGCLALAEEVGGKMVASTVAEKGGNRI